MLQGFARSGSFDTLATKFLDAAADAKSSIADEVTSAAGSLADEAKTNADLYSRFMKKAITKVWGSSGSAAKRLPASCVRSGVCP